MKIKMPEMAEYIVERLLQSGYDAYVVGGCVRDSLLGKPPNDWDICTSALPEETKQVFCNEKIIETGIKHGTIMLISEHVPYEITTFRIEGKYSDLRRPDRVKFVKKIDDDLARRDFTVNAMAYNNRSGLVDIYGGCEDLAAKKIRCVGNPHERFSEDALRIMRAIRFAAVLGFSLDDETKKAAEKLKMLQKNIAKERLNVEFTKTLLSDNPMLIYEYRDVISVFMNIVALADITTMRTLSLMPCDCAVRLATLFYGIMQIENDKDYNIGAILSDMRYDNKTIKKVADIISCTKQPLPKSLKTARFLVGRYGAENVYNAALIENAYAKVINNTDKIIKTGDVFSFIDEIKEKNLCVKISDLMIDGKDLLSVGTDNGIEIGKLLTKLLTKVIEGELPNEKDALLEYVKKNRTGG